MAEFYSRSVRTRKRPIEAEEAISFEEGTKRARIQADPGVAGFILDSRDQFVPVAEQETFAPFPEWNAVEQSSTDNPSLLSTEGAISFQPPPLPQDLTNDSIFLSPSGEELGHTGSTDTSSEKEETESKDEDISEHAAMSDYEGYEREDRTFSAHDLLDTLLAQPASDHSDPDTPGALDLHQEVLALRLSGHPNHLSSPYRVVNALFTLSKRNPRSTHLSEYTELLREALTLVPPGHPQRSFVLQVFALAVILRYNRTGEESDLSEGIERQREVLALFPPGHPQRSYALEHLSCAILARYDESGEESDLSEGIELFREALELQPLNHPDRLTMLEPLANAIFKRYGRDGDEVDLSERIELLREALVLAPSGHPQHSITLEGLALTHLLRYYSSGQEPDLSEGIELLGKVLVFLPPGNPRYSSNLKILANAFIKRYERSGEGSDLSEGIALNREALDHQPLGDPDRPDNLTDLAGALLQRYECEGGASDLSQAINMQREALTLRPPDHPDYSSSLNHLANALRIQYISNGGASNLSEVINMQREALSLQPAGHPNRPSTLSDLATSLLQRYEPGSGSSDLSEAIKLHEEAHNLRPADHPPNLDFANALLRRYRGEGTTPDLLRGIKMYRESLKLSPPRQPHRSAILSNLATALLMRYEILVWPVLRGIPSSLLDLEELKKLEGLDDPDDLSTSEALDEVIELHKEALALRPPGHPDRSQILRNLGSTYLQVFFRNRDSRSALLVAVDYEREALDYQPEQDPWRSKAAFLLAVKLSVIIQHPDSFVLEAGDLPRPEQVIQLLQVATNAETSPISHRFHAAMLWTTVAAEYNPESALDAYLSAINHLGSALRMRRSLQARHDFLIHERPATISLALSAACWALADNHGNSKVAIELLDQGRNALLASVGQFRGDLSDVRRQDPALAEKFYQTSQMLDNAILKNQDELERKSFHEDSTNCYQRISGDWKVIVEEIRLLPNCESFLLPEPYKKLQEAAVGGPIIVVIVGEDKSTAIIVTSDGDPHTISLPQASKDALKSLHREWEDALKTLPNESRVKRTLPKVLSQLWKILAQPIIHDLTNRLRIPLHSRIWWYPTSWASFLPLHAAGTYKTGGSNVPDCYISSYTPTLQALRRARRNYRGHGSGMEPSLLMVSQPRTEGQDEIEYVNEEENVVSRLAHGTVVLSGERGTKENTLEEMRHHSWIHLACHGVPDLTKPFQSHFALHNGPLSLQDIISDDLPFAEFAYLSACHTAAQDRTLPDEGLTLAGGMLFAGFKSVVGTLWKMADEDAPGLAKDFYEDLARRSEDGKGFDCTKTAEALHAAVQRLRYTMELLPGKDKPSRVPLFRWVNLVHYGI